MSSGIGRLEVWFVTGSQHLYGEAVLEQVADDARRSRPASTTPRGSPSRSCPSPCSRRRRTSPGSCARPTRRPTCVGLIAWMHTFSPAKMWIAGLTGLRKPFVHLHTQFNRDLPWSDDRHGLHEPQPVGPRRPGVRVHPDPPAPRPQDGRRPLAGSRGRRAGSARGRARPPAGTMRSRSRIARFGDNMREVAVTEGDKVEAQVRFGFSVNGYGVGDLAAARRGGQRRRGRSTCRRVRRRVRRRAGPPAGRRPHDRAA